MVGVAWGIMDAIIDCHFEAPVAEVASRGSASAFSMASANILPIMPIECKPSASTPASGPMPNA